ncbi:restriction endonuclease subunit S [Pseudolactococcus yaeyamensis]
MQDKLKELEKKYEIEWREYELEDIFSEIKRGNISKQNELIEDINGVNFIAQNDNANGYVKKVQRGENKLFKSKSLVIGRQTGVVYYQPESFITTDGVLVLENQLIKSRSIGLFLSSILQKQMSQFSYSNTVSATKLKGLKINLPTQNGKISFNYMEDFIETLEAYLLATGLDDYELTVEDGKFMNKTENVKWKEYRLDTLFNIYPSKSYSGLKDADILSVKGTIPYISNQSQDNGSIGFSELEPLNKKNVITLSDTWQSERTIFYQGQEFIGKSHLQVLEPFSNFFDKLSAFYIISSFRKAITKLNYDYGTKFNRQKIKSTVIQLPTKDNKPDYDFMARYITVIQKQVIKKLAEWTQKEVEATKEILDKEI